MRQLFGVFKLLIWNGYGININGEYITHLNLVMI